MIRVPNEGSAAERARWLAEVAEALQQARRVVRQLHGALAGAELLELQDKIDALAIDVELMRRLRGSPQIVRLDPEWMKNIPWSLSA